MTNAFDLEGLAQRMQAMQSEVATAASRMQDSETSRTVGGVTVVMSGTGMMRQIHIDAGAVKDIASLEGQILDASQQAFEAVKEDAQSSLSPLRNLMTQMADAAGGQQ